MFTPVAALVQVDLKIEGSFASGTSNVSALDCWGMDRITVHAKFSAAPQVVRIELSMDGVNWDSVNNIGADPSGTNLYLANVDLDSSRFVRVTFQANAGAGATAHWVVALHKDP